MNENCFTPGPWFRKGQRVYWKKPDKDFPLYSTRWNMPRTLFALRIVRRVYRKAPKQAWQYFSEKDVRAVQNGVIWPNGGKSSERWSG